MKTQNQYLIKITSAIIVSLCLQISTLVAGSAFNSNSGNNSTACVNCLKNNAVFILAPVTPSEATFSDEVTNIEISLAPVSPAEATFEELPETLNNDIPELLAPTTPAEATFDDGPDSASAYILQYLAPSTPDVADFND
jgi:hypothetical protein